MSPPKKTAEPEEMVGFAVNCPIIGVRIGDIRMLAETDAGRKMLTIMLLIRSGVRREELETTVFLPKEEIDECIESLIFGALLDREEIE